MWCVTDSQAADTSKSCCFRHVETYQCVNSLEISDRCVSYKARAANTKDGNWEETLVGCTTMCLHLISVQMETEVIIKSAGQFLESWADTEDDSEHSGAANR